MAWSEAARRAAAEARRRKAALGAARRARARAAHAGGSREHQAAGREQERAVARMLRAGGGPAGLSPVDVSFRSAGRLHGVEVKTLTVQRNDKITMNGYALARKQAFARKNKAALHTVAVDLRTGSAKIFYRRGVGSFRLSRMELVSSGAHLRRLVKGGK
jgi:hypothetical protein